MDHLYNFCEYLKEIGYIRDKKSFLSTNQKRMVSAVYLWNNEPLIVQLTQELERYIKVLDMNPLYNFFKKDNEGIEQPDGYISLVSKEEELDKYMKQVAELIINIKLG